MNLLILNLFDVDNKKASSRPESSQTCFCVRDKEEQLARKFPTTHTQGLSLQHLYATTAKQRTNSSAARQRSIHYPVLKRKILHLVRRQQLIGLRHNTLLGLCRSAAHGPAERVTWQADHAGTSQAEQCWVQRMRTPTCNHCWLYR